MRAHDCQTDCSPYLKGNIVRSIDILGEKGYDYYYDNGKIARWVESSIAVDDNEFIVSKILNNTIRFIYDSDGVLSRKIITPSNGAEQIVYYEASDDGKIVKFTAGGQNITSHSKTDQFGRKEFDELQIGTGFVSRQFHS